jgi:hypothetical protein
MPAEKQSPPTPLAPRYANPATSGITITVEAKANSQTLTLAGN